MTTVQSLAAHKTPQEATPDQGAQVNVAQSEAFGSLLRSVGARRFTLEAPADAPVTRKSRAAMQERGVGVKDLRLSDAAKLDYGSMTALELANPGQLPTSEGGARPQAGSDGGDASTRSAERATTPARSGQASSRAGVANPEASRAPAGQTLPPSEQPPAHAPAQAEQKIATQPGPAAKATATQTTSGQVRAVQGAPPVSTSPSLPGTTRGEAGRVQVAPSGPTQARANAQKLLGKLETSAREPREVAPSPHVRQVARAMLAAVRHGQGDISLKLLPEALGRVTVRLSLADESVTACFVPETDSARRLLEVSRDELRAALEARGLRVERIEIDTSRVEPAGTAGPEAGLGAETGRHEGGTGGGDRAGAERTPGNSGEPVVPELEVPVPVDASWIDGASGRVDTLA
ncbi:MAG: flagellar hook-length control protein FliK [Phycisphaerales bacterium]|nr:flagellar hook-length control protein FliK [Phycisphaerales bacterium]